MENGILEQIYAIKFCVKLRRALPIPTKRLRKHFLTILYHVRKYFGGTKTSEIGEKRWKMYHDLDASPLLEQAQTLKV
jgi:hypothetical protein